MFISFLKLLLFFISRPLALYRVYPGAVAFLMTGPIQEAELAQQGLIEKGGEEIVLLTEDQRQIEAMYFPVKETIPESAEKFTDETRPTVIFCLGNDMFYQFQWELFEFYLKEGFNVMTFNYGGYRKSEGSPTAQRTFADVDAAYNFIKKSKETPDSRIIVHGLSLGGGPGAYLASKHPIHLVLDRTYCRVGDVSDNRALSSLANFMYPYDNVSRLKNVKGRIHLIEAQDDKMMKPKHVTELFDEIIRNRHPEASGEEYENLRLEYVTSTPGPHGACILRNKPQFDIPRENFINHFIVPISRQS
jgi:dienelactone hydrolase